MAKKKPMKPVPPGYHEIFVKSFFNKKLGRRFYAWQYGKKAFRLVVKDK